MYMSVEFIVEVHESLVENLFKLNFSKQNLSIVSQWTFQCLQPRFTGG